MGNSAGAAGRRMGVFLYTWVPQAFHLSFGVSRQPYATGREAAGLFCVLPFLPINSLSYRSKEFERTHRFAAGCIRLPRDPKEKEIDFKAQKASGSEQ